MQHGYLYDLWSSFIFDRSVNVKDSELFLFHTEKRCLASASGFCLQYNLEFLRPTSKSQRNGGAERLKNGLLYREGKHILSTYHKFPFLVNQLVLWGCIRIFP